MLGRVCTGTADQLQAMLPRPRWKVGVLRSTTEVAGSSPIQVHPSDEGEKSNEIKPSMTPVVWKDFEPSMHKVVWSQCFPNCRNAADVIPSDESLNDVSRRLWKDVYTREAARHVESPVQKAHAAIEAWSQVSPVLNKCRLLAPDLHGKTIRVLLPCGGIDAPGWAARALGIEFDVVGYYDTDPQYAAYMANVGVDPSRVHVGKDQGYFARLALSHVPECNLLVAGPPCPPFSRSGKHQRFEDDRSHVFFHIMALIGH